VGRHRHLHEVGPAGHVRPLVAARAPGRGSRHRFADFRNGLGSRASEARGRPQPAAHNGGVDTQENTGPEQPDLTTVDRPAARLARPE
jgi:hypothetical protein